MTLVTGASGYIGSHLVEALLKSGREVLALDRRKMGRKMLENTPKAPSRGLSFVQLDLLDHAALKSLLKAYSIDEIVHLAALTSVPESMAKPALYWEANVATTAHLAAACANLPSLKAFIFASTAAVYAPDASGLVHEGSPLAPSSVYGESKLACEGLLRSVFRQSSIRFCAFRYFNVAGGAMSEQSPLLPPSIYRALRDGAKLSIYGLDWPSNDGSAIRDFVHVKDLAQRRIFAI